jgi:hypothetical protein
MRWAVIAGVLGAVLPTLALAQVKVVLGDGVSVVFPGAPIKMHTATVDSPAAPPPAPPARRAPGEPPMPVPPEPGNFGFAADSWLFHKGGASFTAMAMTPRGAHADLPARCRPITTADASGVVSCRLLGSGPSAVREDRRVLEGGDLMISRSLNRGGRVYSVRYTRLAPQKLAKLNATNRTPPESAGDSFLASFSVDRPGSR